MMFTCIDRSVSCRAGLWSTLTKSKGQATHIHVRKKISIFNIFNTEEKEENAWQGTNQTKWITHFHKHILKIGLKQTCFHNLLKIMNHMMSSLLQLLALATNEDFVRLHTLDL